jgi:hypothetical protein
MAEECEYCHQPNEVLYAWQGDTWCRSCIETRGRWMPMIGTLDDAPYGRLAHVSYAQPFIIPQRHGTPR